jgi:sec-independent protein translocase protein TatB
MFDIGALELVLIGVVALLVVGPERLPKLARTAGLWVGRARRAFASVKDEIDREIKAEELKEILRKQAESNPLERILEEDSEARTDTTSRPDHPGRGAAPAHAAGDQSPSTTGPPAGKSGSRGSTGPDAP